MSNNRTPLLQHTRAMSAGLNGEPDLTVSIGATRGTSPQALPYYESAHPFKDYVDVDEDVRIYYEVHGLPPGGTLEDAMHLPKVVMIMGLACGCSAWRWQLQDLVQQHQMVPDYAGSAHERSQQQQTHLAGLTRQQQQQQLPAAWVTFDRTKQQLAEQQQWHADEKQQQRHGINKQQMLVCIIDNRGVGHSSSPTDPTKYSTNAMARDAIAVMDKLQWDRAHVLGFSMGGMIAQRLAVIAPSRLSSLTLLSTSAGGWQIVPVHSWSGFRTAFKMVTARTPEDAADATLRFHFRRRTLKTWVGHLAARRQELLRREYMTPDDAVPPQPQHGFKGQLRACWRHSLSNKDAQAIAAADFPILVIHGRSDKLASAANAEALARRLGAPCVLLPGAHFVVRECAGQINMLLSSLVLGQQHITSVLNEPYMDPSPSIQKAWQEQHLLPHRQHGKQHKAASEMV